MAANRRAKPKTQPITIMPGFIPMRGLWSGGAPLYPSEQSARWARRRLEPYLIEAQAIARLRGEIVVHPQRWAEAEQREAFQALIPGGSVKQGVR